MALLGKAAVVIWVDMDAGMLGQHVRTARSLPPIPPPTS
jgi:hypothetical protein